MDACASNVQKAHMMNQVSAQMKKAVTSIDKIMKQISTEDITKVMDSFGTIHVFVTTIV